MSAFGLFLAALFSAALLLGAVLTVVSALMHRHSVPAKGHARAEMRESNWNSNPNRSSVYPLPGRLFLPGRKISLFFFLSSRNF